MPLPDERPAADFPRKRVDLLLVHAPTFFDFRDRDDIYFPYLSTSGDVPITPLYEYGLRLAGDSTEAGPEARLGRSDVERAASS